MEVDGVHVAPDASAPLDGTSAPASLGAADAASAVDPSSYSGNKRKDADPDSPTSAKRARVDDGSPEPPVIPTTAAPAAESVNEPKQQKTSPPRVVTSAPGSLKLKISLAPAPADPAPEPVAKKEDPAPAADAGHSDAADPAPSAPPAEAPKDAEPAAVADDAAPTIAAPESAAAKQEDDQEDDEYAGSFVYSPHEMLPTLEGAVGMLIDVYVGAEYVIKGNPRVAARCLWGNGVFTDDSDPVASTYNTCYCLDIMLSLLLFIVILRICAHFCSFLLSHLFASVLQYSGSHPVTDSSPAHDLRLRLRVLPPQALYPSAKRHGVESRTWPPSDAAAAHDGVSLRLESCVPLQRGEAARRGRRGLKSWRLDQQVQERAEVLPSGVGAPVFPDIRLRFARGGEPCVAYSRWAVLYWSIETARARLCGGAQALCLEDDEGRHYEVARVKAAAGGEHVVDKEKEAEKEADKEQEKEEKEEEKEQEKENADAQEDEEEEERYQVVKRKGSGGVDVLTDKIEWDDIRWTAQDVVLDNDTRIPITKYYWRQL